MYDVTLRHYSGRRLAVQVNTSEDSPFATSGSRFATLSINVPSVELKRDEFVLNHDLNSEIFADFRREMLEQYFEDTGKRVSYGFVIDQPVWRLRRGTVLT
jgi:hypothetical protein